MKLSFGTRLKRLGAINGTNGYGYATKCMLQSLDTLGYHIEANDASADAELWFDQPEHWKHSDGPYKIGYHPWESTHLKPGWAEIMNACDEIWTPSPLIAQWYRQYAGIRVPVYVYEHGIEHSWEPKPRQVEDKIRFLMVGAEATRKGGWDTMRLFRKAFPNRDDVELTIKTQGSGHLKMDNLGRVKFINAKYSLEQLQQLYYEHHIYVYPSWGEGFGLTPFQAIATGMPTITCPAWAPYRRFLDNDLSVSSSLAKSSWPKIHPGYMLRPSFDDVVDRLRYAAENFDAVHAKAQKVAPQVHVEYDWDDLTRQTFVDLEKRLFDRDFEAAEPVEVVSKRPIKVLLK